MVECDGLLYEANPPAIWYNFWVYHRQTVTDELDVYTPNSCKMFALTKIIVSKSSDN